MFKVGAFGVTKLSVPLQQKTRQQLFLFTCKVTFCQIFMSPETQNKFIFNSSPIQIDTLYNNFEFMPIRLDQKAN